MLLRKAVYNSEPSAPSKWPKCIDRLSLRCGSRTPSHQILASTKYFWISSMCHLLVMAASLSNLSPTALCSGLLLPAKSTANLDLPRYHQKTPVCTRLHGPLVSSSFLQWYECFHWREENGWGALTNLSKSWPTMPASTRAVKFFSSIHRIRFCERKM